MNTLCCWVDETDSTNQDLLDWAEVQSNRRVSPSVPCVLATTRQHRGRGRQGNIWQSLPDQTLCLSYLEYAQPSQALWLGPWVALAIVQAAKSLGLSLGLKWPNDILSDDGRRKLAGILIERGSGEAVVVGVGINVIAAPAQDKASKHALPPIALQELWRDQYGVTRPYPAEWADCREAAFWLTTVIEAAIRMMREGDHARCLKAFQCFDCYDGQIVDVWDQGKIIHQGLAGGIQSCGAYLVGHNKIYAGHIRLAGAAQ